MHEKSMLYHPRDIHVMHLCKGYDLQASDAINEGNSTSSYQAI